MKVHCLGYHHEHDHDFKLDRPVGLSHCLFLFFKSSAWFVIGGKKYDVKPYSFIIITEEVPYHYGASENTYVDDWMHFNLSAQDKQDMNALDIPINTVVQLGEGEDVTNITLIFKLMTQDFYQNRQANDMLMSSYWQIIINKIANEIELIKRNNLLPQHHKKFYQIRTQIQNTPNNIMCIDDLAKSLFISRSHFQHTYKQLFGVSVIEDVITSRLNLVRSLLLSSDMPLSKVAEKSGYRSEYHLIRQFKQRFDMTPTEFRKRRKNKSPKNFL